jgi:hypothetical protein
MNLCDVNLDDEALQTFTLVMNYYNYNILKTYFYFSPSTILDYVLSVDFFSNEILVLKQYQRSIICQLTEKLNEKRPPLSGFEAKTFGFHVDIATN